LGSALAPALIQVDYGDAIYANLEDICSSTKRGGDMTDRAHLLWSFVKQKWLHDKAFAMRGSAWTRQPEEFWEPHQGWGEDESFGASGLGQTFSEHLASFECLGDDEAWERLQRCYDESPRTGRFSLPAGMGFFDSGATSLSGDPEDAPFL
jgi:hypothetical protein